MVNSQDNSFSEILTFLFVVDTLLATAITYFVDKKNFIPETYQKLIVDYYVLPIVCLIIAFVCFNLVKNELTSKDVFYYKKWLMISAILGALILFISAYIAAIPHLVVLQIIILVIAIAFNFVIPIFLVMLPLFVKLVKIWSKEKLHY